MKLLDAYESGYRFRHKDWCETCWHENKGKSLRIWIGKNLLNDSEIFDNNWLIEKEIKPKSYKRIVRKL